MADRAKARFIDPMLLLKTEKLPESQDVIYELKLDGYRAIAFKSGGKVCLRSRNDNDFASRYPSIAKALQTMPDETVIDGEVVALDENGKPSFNLLQNYGSGGAPLDLLRIRCHDLVRQGRDGRNARSTTRVCWRRRFCRSFMSRSGTLVRSTQSSQT